MTSPPPPPEAALLRRKREAPPRLSMSEAARRAGMSPTRWRQIEAGYRLFHGRHEPETAPDQTLAAMARAVGITAAELREAGRDGAAGELEALLADPAPAGSDDDLREQLDRIETLARRVRDQLDERERLRYGDRGGEAGSA